MRGCLYGWGLCVHEFPWGRGYSCVSMGGGGVRLVCFSFYGGGWGGGCVFEFLWGVGVVCLSFYGGWGLCV